MKKRKDKGLTQLADAAFKQVARKVLRRAEESGTPVILWVGQEVKAVDPRAVRNGHKRGR